MSLEDLKTEVADLPREEQDQLAAYLQHLRHQRETRIVTGPELAAALRLWEREFSREEHLEIAAQIEGARRRMNDEHLH